MIHPKTGRELRKVFLKDATDATGTEISLNSLSAEAEIPYFHTHKTNEETYIILRGTGLFQVDEDCFRVREGSVVRVAPAGKRGMYNDSQEELICMVIHSTENSLGEYSSDDGEIVDVRPAWK